VEIFFDPAPVRHTLWIQLVIAVMSLLLLCSRRVRDARLIGPRIQPTA